jgi:hypothetical protein
LDTNVINPICCAKSQAEDRRIERKGVLRRQASGQQIAEAGASKHQLLRPACRHASCRWPPPLRKLVPKSFTGFPGADDFTHNQSSQILINIDFRYLRTSNMGFLFHSIEMKYQYNVPAKCVTSPNRLQQAMYELAGPGNFRIEVSTALLMYFGYSSISNGV